MPVRTYSLFIVFAVLSAAGPLISQEKPLILNAGTELQPGWAGFVNVKNDDLEAAALHLSLAGEAGRKTGAAYWSPTDAGRITRGAVELQPFRRYRATARVKVSPVGGSGTMIVFHVSDGPEYSNLTWRNVRSFFSFQFKEMNSYQDLSLEFCTGKASKFHPEVKIVNIGPLEDGRSTGGGDIADIYLENIRFEDITPDVFISDLRCDKGFYRRADKKAFSFKIRNSHQGEKAISIRAVLVSDIDEEKEIHSSEEKLAPGTEKDFAAEIPGTGEFGHEIRVEISRDGKLIDSAVDYFGVADNVYKIQMNSVTRMTNPPAFCWSGAVDMRLVPEVVESMRAQSANFYEFFAWPPDDGLDFVPKNENWWAGQNGYPENRSNLKGIIDELHKHGIWAVMYAAWWSCGTGIETFRRHPDWFLFDSDTGRGGGCDLESYKKAKELVKAGKEGIGLQKNGGGASPNWTDPKVVDAGLDSMSESIKLFGWDGVRWDGEYQVTYFWEMMDINGKLIREKYKSLDDANLQILSQVIERYKKEWPNFVWGYNNEMNLDLWKNSVPKLLDYKLKCGGSIMWESPRCANEQMNPNHTFSEYSANTAKMADFVRERGGYFMQFPAGYGWVGTAHDRIYKAVIPVVCGSTNYGNSAGILDSMGEYNRFIARYSALWWGDNVRSVKNPGKFISVESKSEIWWKDYVDTRPAGDGTDIIINLLNAPVNKEIANDAKGAMPPAQKNVKIKLENIPEIEKAWFLTAEPKIRCEPIPIAGNEIVVPELRIWSVAVIRIKGKLE